jgi:simple sugar transport system ATP-binding protein/ribose transport system ATP-binding protein
MDPGAAPGSIIPVEVISISKRFGATQALDDVSLKLFPGEVHAFAGENGAGKSTLGKIISGLYSADSGQLLINGLRVQKWDTARAQKSGVVLIAQELSLVPKLTVAENVFLGVETNTKGILKRDMRERYDALEALTDFGLNPNRQVDQLRLADRQKVEILRALARDAKVIIMDEPTSSLTSDEVDKLHGVIRRLSEQGRSIIYVTHFLEALLDTADRVTVLRDGRLIKTSNTLDETKQSLVESMLGRSISSAFPPRSHLVKTDAESRLELKSVSSDNGTSNVSLTIRPGEIVGLAGLVGSGRSEIAKVIFGVDQMTSGKIIFDGIELKKITPTKSISRGIVMIPEDRRKEGLVIGRSVKENVSLPHLKLVTLKNIINKVKEINTVKELIKIVQVNPPRIYSLVSDFSGGNQQKVLLAKWMMGNPSVVIFDEPTRGVDIGAKVTIYETIVKLAESGVSVLMISSEHEEVMALSNRVYLVRDGGIIGEIDPATKSVDDVLLALFDLKSSKNHEENG